MLQQTTPYFYIIKNTQTGIQYAGSKWAAGCHPSEFMKASGYCTSSKIIAEIIERDGLSVFETVSIVTDLGGLTALEYETEFLQSNNCAASPNWYNRHNNNTNGVDFSFGSDGFKQSMLAKHGVEHPMYSDQVKEKLKGTNLDRHGCESVFQNDEIKAKIKMTNLKNLGCENPMHNDGVKDKLKQTNLGKFGVEHAAQNEEVKAKTKTTNLNRFGCECSLQNEEVKAKTKITNLDKFGCEHPMHNEEVKTKLKTTNIDKYGCEYTMQNEEVKEKSKITMIDKYGASNYTQSETYRNTFYTCSHCEKKSNNAANMKRWHNDNCKHKPKDISVD